MMAIANGDDVPARPSAAKRREEHGVPPPGGGARANGRATDDSRLGQDGDVPPIRIILEDALVDEAGILLVRGWAVSQTPIEQIAVFLNDRLLGLAEGLLPRADVGRVFPHYPNAARGGFSFRHRLAEPNLTRGTIRVVVLVAGGTAAEVSARLGVLHKAQRIAPGAAAIRFHCDDLQLSEDGMLSVIGWAVCQPGIEAIAIDLDGVFVGFAETGRDRPDVGSHFPLLPSAGKAGFRFFGALGARYEGDHVVRITIRGQDGETQAIDRPVRATGHATRAGEIRLFSTCRSSPLGLPPARRPARCRSPVGPSPRMG